MYRRKEAILNEVRLLTNSVKDVLQLQFIELKVKQSCVYKTINRNIIPCSLNLFPNYAVFIQVKVKIFIKYKI